MGPENICESAAMGNGHTKSYGVDLPEELVRKQVTEELTCEGATENS